MAKRSAAIEIKGIKQLQKKLEQFTPKIQRKVMRPAITKATTPIVKAARRLAPVGKGLKPGGVQREHLAKTITKTRPKLYPSGNLVVVIGPEAKKAPHSHLVHDGTKAHEIKLGKPLTLGGTSFPIGYTFHHPGSKANPFLTNAINATRSKSFSILRSTIAAGIEKQAKQK